MAISTIGFSIMFRPNTGKLAINKGRIAQWIAHAKEAIMPKPSQFTFRPIGAKVQKSNNVANIILHRIWQFQLREDYNFFSPHLKFASFRKTDYCRLENWCFSYRFSPTNKIS